ncbi:MAG: hypothetical protein Q9M91_06005 [Candidatus Dojkabacteria bacterium]|nr:hypothetical protein [Candidatus Dojkabacteria bacterium]MDQ7021353.1 hypothetical protein [Candidatus Dojkabacteria bacterium]
MENYNDQVREVLGMDVEVSDQALYQAVIYKQDLDYMIRSSEYVEETFIDESGTIRYSAPLNESGEINNAMDRNTKSERNKLSSYQKAFEKKIEIFENAEFYANRVLETLVSSSTIPAFNVEVLRETY